jgi:hypothetical protein
MAEAGNATRYGGNLLCGISFGDTRENVEQKLGFKPISSKLVPGRTPQHPKDLWEQYELAPFELTFMFHAPSNTLSSFSINYGPADINTRPAPREPETYFDAICTGASLRVLNSASLESRKLGHNWVGSEQILLALLAEKQGPAATALKPSGLKIDLAREKAKEINPPLLDHSENLEGYTLLAKYILEGSLAQALQLGCTKVRPEHLLLALIDEGEGIAERIFQIFEVDTDALRRQVLSLCKPSK